MVTITITDTITGKVATVAGYDVADTLHGWYQNAPDEVRSALVQLEEAINRGEPTEGLEQYLAISINRTPGA